MVDDLYVICRLFQPVLHAELYVLVLLILVYLSSQFDEQCPLAHGLQLLIVIIRNALQQVLIVAAKGRIQGAPSEG